MIFSLFIGCGTVQLSVVLVWFCLRFFYFTFSSDDGSTERKTAAVNLFYLPLLGGCFLISLGQSTDSCVKHDSQLFFFNGVSGIPKRFDSAAKKITPSSSTVQILC